MSNEGLQPHKEEKNRTHAKEEQPEIGDYVLATKWADGDPHDQWAVGFLSEKLENERFLVVDKEGRSFRHSGFRRVAKISKERGDHILANVNAIENSSVSLWCWVRKKIVDIFI